MSSPRDTGIPIWTRLFLGAATLWYLYFWLVYLGAEAGCAVDGSGPQILGIHWVSLVTTVVTGITLLLIVWSTWLAVSHWRGRRADPASTGQVGAVLTGVGALLGGMFLLATIFVGLPALVLQPC